MKRRILNFVGLTALFFIAAIGAQVSVESARAAFWQWSKTASNNNTADPSINWSEGMSPSSVNDSARAMMARLAEQAADVSGSLTTAGGPVAYTVTSNQGFPSPPLDGMVIGVTFNVTNSANPTLQVDGSTAYPIVAAGIGAPVGALVAANPYTLKFSATASAWVTRNWYGTSLVPLGALVPYTGTVAPNADFMLPAGQCISTTTYAAYWGLLGSPAPGACSAGQFQIIDMRGRVPAALDNLGGTAAGRMTANSYGCGVAFTTVGAACNTFEYHAQTAAEMPAHFHGAAMYDPQHYHTATIADPGHFHATSTADPGHYHTAGIYDAGHGHNFIQNGGATATVYTNVGPQYYYYQGGAQGAQQYATQIQASGTGVRVNSSNGLDLTYTAGTGVYMSSGNGANTVGSKATGVYVNGVAAGYTSYGATGVRVNTANGLDQTATAGSSSAMPVVQPTVGVGYLLRVQ